MAKLSKLFKSTASLFFAIILFGSLLVPYSFAEEVENDIETETIFVDIPEGTWYTEAVYYVNENGIMRGTSTDRFSPSNNVTRQQVWMCLARLSSEDPETMEDARQWAMDKQVSDGSNPTGNISRQELAAMLYNFAFNFGYDVSKAGSLISYRDCNMVQEWAEVGLQWAIGSGIITGTGNQMINPTGTATRAQFATIMMRFMQMNEDKF